MKRQINKAVTGLAISTALYMAAGCGENTEMQQLDETTDVEKDRLPEHIRQQFYTILQITTSGEGASDKIPPLMQPHIESGSRKALEAVLNERLATHAETIKIINQKNLEPRYYEYYGSDILSTIVNGHIYNDNFTLSDVFNNTQVNVIGGTAYQLTQANVTETVTGITDIRMQYAQAKQPDYIWYLVGNKGDKAENFKGGFIANANEAFNWEGSFEYIALDGEEYCYFLVYGEDIVNLDEEDCFDLRDKILNSAQYGFGNSSN